MVRSKARSEDVTRWRRKTKERLVQRLGGKCSVCEWFGNNAGFDFHHVGGKDFGIASALANPVRYESLLDEVDKCVLLCALCHRLEHAGPSYDEEVDGPLFRPLPREPPVCQDCGTAISFGCERCNSCAGKQQWRAEWPSNEQLVREVAETSYSAVGRKYGVSDVAVRKRIKKIHSMC